MLNFGKCSSKINVCFQVSLLYLHVTGWKSSSTLTEFSVFDIVVARMMSFHGNNTGVSVVSCRYQVLYKAKHQVITNKKFCQNILKDENL